MSADVIGLRYVVTSAQALRPGETGWRGLYLLGRTTSRERADRLARLERLYGGRALIHDLKTGLIIRDTGRPLRQTWEVVVRTGDPSPRGKEVRS